tara:strand:+ start:4727 stop:4924 length:198 start_codon:yes stop_codon:yes gene_type:complete
MKRKLTNRDGSKEEGMTEEERRKVKHIIFELKRFDDINPENYKLVEKALELFLKGETIQEKNTQI